MLTVTENASSAIRALTVENGMSDNAGLRIYRDEQEGQDGLAVALSETPDQTDQVVGVESQVFLDPIAADRLGEATLDADIDESGKVSFFLSS